MILFILVVNLDMWEKYILNRYVWNYREVIYFNCSFDFNNVNGIIEFLLWNIWL